mmetsp:Transcript_15798/g.49024  ORF Transcript_15798/g.49024 Transcript_15798/m.49024 type:complete len:298 (-) Transcript_15798:29-922(-)
MRSPRWSARTSAPWRSGGTRCACTCRCRRSRGTCCRRCRRERCRTGTGSPRTCASARCTSTRRSGCPWRRRAHPRGQGSPSVRTRPRSRPSCSWSRSGSRRRSSRRTCGWRTRTRSRRSQTSCRSCPRSGAWRSRPACTASCWRSSRTCPWRCTRSRTWRTRTSWGQRAAGRRTRASGRSSSPWRRCSWSRRPTCWCTAWPPGSCSTSTRTSGRRCTCRRRWRPGTASGCSRRAPAWRTRSARGSSCSPARSARTCRRSHRPRSTARTRPSTCRRPASACTWARGRRRRSARSRPTA